MQPASARVPTLSFLYFQRLPFTALTLPERPELSPMKAIRYRVPLNEVPVDFFADPDGEWTYDDLLAIAGWKTADGVAIGALTAPFRDHPAGSAVVTLNAKDRPYIVVVECPAVGGAFEDLSEFTAFATVA